MMISQSDIERERYESRRKAELDQLTMLNFARAEGRKEGIEEGRKEAVEFKATTDKIKLCERFLRLPETPLHQLSHLSLTELTLMANELENRALDRD